MKRYVWLFHDSKTMNNFYYDELTGQICLLKNKKSGKGISAGVIAGFSVLIYVFVRRIERPVFINKEFLYWLSLGIGIALGIFLSWYGIKRARRKIAVSVNAAHRFLMLWIAPSVLVYAFLHSLMCMITVLLIAAFVGNRPLKGWKIADKMRKGKI